MNVAKRYQDLVCWQLADELEKLVIELTETGPVSKDFKFRDQIRDSSPKSSLFETHNLARSGCNRGYFSAADTDRMQRLCARSGKAATNLIRYLESLGPKPRRRGRGPRKHPRKR